eukprot:TRINITY_DN1066_c0_g1_i2.p1 TRINITY_DN1066_c0_g1~~TRINITY_DN1066_c0_g1_i2.p1  ORF type:complete len:153 (+),score=28.51 TRINITY_DN1066_c0_g1_i2:508-966(+)
MDSLNGKINFSTAPTTESFSEPMLIQTESPGKDSQDSNSLNPGLKKVAKKTAIPIVPSSGLCTKCNGKRRHTRTCPFRKREEEDEINFTSQQIIGRLDIAALKRYKKHFRLKTRHNISKAELVTAVKQHYDAIQLNEIETIELFLDKAKQPL